MHKQQKQWNTSQCICTHDMTNGIGGDTKMSLGWYRYQTILASIDRHPIPVSVQPYIKPNISYREVVHSTQWTIIIQFLVFVLMQLSSLYLNLMHGVQMDNLIGICNAQNENRYCWERDDKSNLTSSSAAASSFASSLSSSSSSSSSSWLSSSELLSPRPSNCMTCQAQTN